ncbi:MAG: Two component regulator three Y domain-containing protein, partial [Cellulophaga sp.]
FGSFKNNELLYYNNDHFWFIDNENSKKITYTNFKEDNIIIENQSLKKRIIPEAENIIKVNDSTFYFTLVDGYSQINFNKLNNQLKDNNRLPVPKLISFNGKENSYPIHTKSITLPYKDSRNITVKIASSGIMHPKYYYSLNGKDAQFAELNNGLISFQNLGYGSYALEVFGVGIDNKKSVPNNINFTIKAPWYLSGPAILIYFLLTIVCVILIRKYNKYKLNIKHNKLKERLQHEQDEKIALLEKEKLAKEVKIKQKELANTTLNIAKKNEIILDLKNLLTQNKDKFPNQQRYKSFMKRLNNSVNNKEDWKRFEMNFKELHSDFFENLLKQYPKLTPKDLKLCAYLKMNLSTKEIAPLMAITIRGVEIHRYRLRKKLNIDSSENISNFLITFK